RQSHGKTKRICSHQQGKGSPHKSLKLSRDAKRSAFIMKPADIIGLLDLEFPGKIKSKNLEALDPFIVVEPGDFLDICRFLKGDSRLSFELLNCITGVDYLEPDAKKVAKAGFEPHTEVVYHFSSLTHRHRLVVKMILPRWKDNKPGELPEVPSVTDLW